MGLAERRATQDFQNTVFPDLKKQIDAAAGFEVPMEVKWESLAVANEANIYKEYWTKIYFEPLIAAFQALCTDDLGKQALKDSLKNIEILNSGDKYDDRGFSFEGGVLKLDHKLVNADSVELRTGAIVSMMEKAL